MDAPSRAIDPALEHPPRPIRVLIVDDSFFMRTVLSKLLAETGGIEIVGQARSGKDAIEKNISLEPDVVTLDVEMPEMNGLEALRRMMETRPVPIVMLSAHTETGAEIAVRALEMGAVECVGKPSGSVSVDIHRVMDELVSKISAAARSRPRLQGVPSVEFETIVPPTPPAGRRSQPADRIVAVASSTGGPKALNELVRCLPEELPAALLVVQHMSLGFTRALAKRLGLAGRLPVEEARLGEILMEGQVYVAPAGQHLLIEGQPGAYRVVLQDGPPRNGVKPAADVLMSSVAAVAGPKSVGIVLTGMGKDGMRGLDDMRKAGARTYAQDEASCVVYGMPKAAVESGAAEQQLTIPGIAEAVVRDLGR